MPRPQRIKDRESAASPSDITEQPVIETPQAANAAIDGADETGQSSVASVVEDDADPFLTTLAEQTGWSKDGQRDGKPVKNPLTARQWLERLPTEYSANKERLRRTLQMSEAAAEDARKQGIREAEARLSTAVDTGDKAGAQEAARDLARHSEVPPQTTAWIARNPWFNVDPAARMATAVVMEEGRKRGLTIEQQLAEGEDFARKRFPEHFPEVRQAESRETRLSQTPPPLVTGGSRGAGPTQTKARGWSDMPAQARNAMEQFVRKAVRRGQTETDSRAFLARAYWAEQR